MANAHDGRSTSQRNINVPLSLAGIPNMQKSAQKTSEFDFDFAFDASLDVGLETHINTFCVNAGLMNDLEVTTGLAPMKAGLKPAELSQPCLPQGQYLHMYDLADHSSLSIQQQTLEHHEPQGYYTACETPYFDNHFNTLPPSLDMMDTPNLTMTPINGVTGVYENDQYPFRPCACPTESWLPRTGVVSLPTEHTDCIPVEASSHNTVAMRVATSLHEEPLTTVRSQSFETGPLLLSETDGVDPAKVSGDLSHSSFNDEIKESSATPVTEQMQKESQKSGSDSDDEYQVTESNKALERWNWNQNSSSFVSSDSVSPAEPVKYLPGERPKKVDSKPWIRTNANTEGDTRTAKINNWKNRYEYKPLPLGTWNSGKHIYRYTKYENVDFLAEAPISTRKVKEYIAKYPCDNYKRLVLWIQKMPADQGRRYGSKQHSKCVFRDCPIQRYVEGTISTGEYRVAFDEKHFTHGDESDPYDCAAYAHLYCMEQFLDFELVCQIADVRVDTRLDMPLEPNGKAAFSMVDVPARHEMERFIKAASKGRLRSTQRWQNYPIHASFDPSQQKPHEFTLTYLAHCMYEAHQDDSHKKQAALRRVTVSQRRVHLGDLEMSVADKRIINEVFGGKKKGRKGKIEDHYDERILYHIERAKREAENFLEQHRQTKKPGRKGRDREFAKGEETEDGENMYDRGLIVAHGTEPCASPLRKTRMTRGKKRRVNYADSPVEAQYQHAQAPYPQSHTAQAPDQQVQQLQTSMATNLSYEPISKHIQPPTDPTLDTAYGVYAMPATCKPSCSNLSTTEENTLDISNLPIRKSETPNDNQKMLALGQRQPCGAGLGAISNLKSMELLRSSHTPRRAVFDAQPVSSSKEYFADDPPSLVADMKSVPPEFNGCHFDYHSVLITAKTKSSGEEWRIRKCARLS